MKKYLIIFSVAALVTITIAFVIKSKFFYAPYPNLIDYVLAVLLLLLTCIMLLWRKHRKLKLLFGIGAMAVTLLSINLLNYLFEWHPLRLALPFSASQSFEVSHEPYVWQTRSPEQAGLNAEPLEAYLKQTEKWRRLRGLLIVKDDKLVVEKYYQGATRFSAFNIHSMTKSITSALIGLAVQQGKINSEDAQVLPYFPEYKTEDISGQKEVLTLKQLLTMRGGFTGPDGYQTAEDCLLREEVTADQEKPFHYFTGSQQLLSAVLTKATAQPTKAFATQYLFKPLGIQNGFWRKIDGIYCGGGESYFTARDLARFGSLYLHNGRLDGKQLLDSVWVAKSFANYSPNSNAFRKLGSYQEVGYGYCWWLLQAADKSMVYAARGKGGQHLLLIPSKKTIVVILQEWNMQKDAKSEEKFIHDLLALL